MSTSGKSRRSNFDSPVLCEMEAHKRDVFTPEPVVLKPSATKREIETMDDVTDFPK